MLSEIAIQVFPIALRERGGGEGNGHGGIFHPPGWRQTMTVKQAAVTVGDSKQVTESRGVESSEKSSGKILGLLKKTPTLTIREAAQQLGISQRAVEKQIEKLKKEGRLRRVGPDKGGHWQAQKIDK